MPKDIKATVDDAASKLLETAASTKAAMVGLAVLGSIALVVALVALAVAARKD
jgi:hypothetical protein